MSTPSEEMGGLTTQEWARVQGILKQFEAAWQRGERPAVEAFLSGEASRRVVLLELIQLEMELRLKGGESARVEDYFPRFPELEGDVEGLVLLLGWEFELRTRREPGLGLSDYCQRFPHLAEALAQRLPEQVCCPTISDAVATAVTPVSLPAVAGLEVLERVGKGGMAVVYRARQVGLNRTVALKMLLDSEHARTAEMARFKAEAEAIARLQHPNIVAIHEVGEHNGKPYFLLEYCSGGSLDRKLAGKPLEAEHAAHLVEMLARAIQAAHQAQVIHRDLKPANVLLAEDGTPKVADFGLARRLDQQGQTQTGAVIGTPSYMAPEQAQSLKVVGPAADVYALGAILYECLTGRPPFLAATAFDTLRQVIHDEPIPPMRLNAVIPADLQTICLKCLRKEPDRRYGSAEDLAEDLRRFQVGEPIVARPVGKLERLVNWVRRRPAVAGLLAAVVLLLIGGTAISTYFAVLADMRKRETRRALEQTEDTLAAGLLRSISRTKGELTDEEVEALWQLSEVQSDRVRQRFLEMGLATPEGALRLGLRADYVARALVGMDDARRKMLRQVLMNRLRDENAPQAVREACVVVGLGMEIEDKEFARCGSSLLLSVLRKTTEPQATAAIVKAVVSLADRLEEPEASTICSAVAGHLPEMLDRAEWPKDRFALANAVTSLADRLKDTEAAFAAANVLKALGNEKDRYVRGAMAKALASLARKREKAPPQVELTSEDMQTLEEKVSLPPIERATQAKAVTNGEDKLKEADHILDVLAKEETSKGRVNLAKTIASLTSTLKETEAHTVAAQAIEIMRKARDLKQPTASVAKAVASLASRLHEPEAAQLCYDVTIRLMETEAQTPYYNTSSAFVDAMADLLEHLRPAEILEVAKTPFCVTKGREAVLAAASRRAKVPITSFSAFARWVRRTDPLLDLTSPPRRPLRSKVTTSSSSSRFWVEKTEQEWEQRE